MSIYRFSIDEFTILESQPIGWENMELNIARDSWAKGLFITYLSDLTLWGDGWDYCAVQLDVNGLCSTITMLIEVDRAHNGKFKTLFNGYGDFSEAKIDHEKCQITFNFKDNLIMKQLRDAWDHSVWISNPLVESIGAITLDGSILKIDVNDDGTIIPFGSCCRRVDYHSVINGTYVDPSLGTFSYKVIDLLNYIMGIISNMKVKVVSDFFTQTSYQCERWDIHISSGTIGPGDSVTINFKSGYAFTYTTFGLLFITNELTTLQSIATTLLQNMDLGNVSFANAQRVVYEFFDNTKFSAADAAFVSGANRIIAESFIPITDFTITCSNPAVIFSVTQTQEITYGMKNLFAGFAHELSGLSTTDGVDKTLSFKTLFDALDARFCLGMALQSIEGINYELRIEPLEYFFNQPEVIDLGGIMNISSEYNDKLTIKNLTVGSKGGDTFGPLSGRKQNWYISKCIGPYEDKDTQANYDIGSIFRDSSPMGQWIDDKYPNTLEFFLAEEALINKGLCHIQTLPLTEVKTQQWVIGMVNTNATPIPPVGFIYAYNAGLINYWAVRNHLFIMNGDAKTKALSIPEPSYEEIIYNTDDSKTRRNYAIDSILTDDEVQVLIANPFAGIGFDKDPTNHLTKGLYELKWNVNTGKAIFELFG